jgi:hypothetical protein
MTYEYNIEFFSMKLTTLTTEVSPEAHGTVYACGEEGECAIRDVREEQIQNLQVFLNDKGREGWELVQILFNRKGAVTFWKRPVAA